MANPDPEIDYKLAVSTRPDILMATGRSDYPNQVNNVLGFPFIFRGALDVRATAINEDMKLAAVRAIADLALEPVPEVVMMAYNDYDLDFGSNYIIPKPMDPRLLTTVAPAVAMAAMDSGVARTPIADWDAYKATLRKRLGIDNDFVNRLVQRARKQPKRVVFSEAEDVKILRAAQICMNEGIATPVLLGRTQLIKQVMEENNIDLGPVTMLDPWTEDALCEEFGGILYEKRKRNGLTQTEAVKNMRYRNYFGAMLVETGKCDALISGLTRNYPIALRPMLECIPVTGASKRIAGMHIVMTKNGPVFLSDTTVNIDYKPEELVDLVLKVHERVSKFQIEPRIALVTYSNFGSSRGPAPIQMRKAVELLHEHHPHILVDGEMQTTYAMDGEARVKQYPFNKLGNKPANTLIFPGLNSGNAAYQLMRGMGMVDIIGPVLLGFEKSVHVLHHTSNVREIVNMVALAVCEAQEKS
jgi:malate dehydrogenase (oxaloacetate-decarboxylating)(NADP+)